MKTLILLVCGGLCVCVALSLLPETAQGLPECHIHRYTGILCPGCGTTRALRAMLHGEWLLSLRSNLLVLPAFAWLAALCCISNSRLHHRVLWWGIGVSLLYTVLRNIPLEALDVLRPL
ncbi:MAG: DUF2752 domain-containing protein [Akkermansia sp.]|nr:DUF2752 domain-containing protein [Akkermansia sp.]